MKDIENEIPFAVPEGWAWCRLGEVCSIIMGQSPESSFISNNSDGMEFHQGKIHFTEKYIQKANNYTFSITKIAPKNAILLCVRAPVGVVNITEREICIGRGLCSIYPKYQIQSEFWFYWLQCQKDTFEQKATGTTFQAISIELIKNILIPLPPLAEQKRIVTAIEAIFTQIDLMEQNKVDLQTAVKQVKSKILDLAIHGKLVLQDPADEPTFVMLERLRAEKEAKIAAGEIKRSKNDSYIYRSPTDNCYYEKFDGKSDVCIDNEIPFDAPNGWMWCRLKNISSEILYGVNESAKQSGSYRLLRITDIQNNYVNWEKVPFADYSENKVEQYLLRNNDIVFARTGATVGKSYLIENLNKAAIYASYLIRIRIFDNLNPKYIKYFFRSLTYWKQITDKTFGIGQPNVNGTSLGRVFISIPPITEQKRIVARIEEIFNALDDIQSNLV